METKVEKLPKSRVKIHVKVPKEKIQKHFDNTLAKLSPGVQIKGFRPGVAPKALVIESIGLGRFYQEALNDALSETFLDALTKENLISVSQPALSIQEFAEGKDFSYTAEVDILPEIDLGDWKKISVKIEHKPTKIDPKQIESTLKNLQLRAAKFEPKDGMAENGDRVEIDFEGTIDNVKQDSLTSKNHPVILGEGALLADFEKNLVGMKAGEEKEFDIEVPAAEDKQKKKQAHFKVRIIDIKKVILPELNDEFAKTVQQKSLADLRGAIEHDYIERGEQSEIQKAENEVLERIVKLAKIDLPESMIETEISNRLLDLQKQIGPNWESFLTKVKKTVVDLRKDLREQAEKNVKIGLLLGEIAKAEKLPVPKEGLKDPKAQQEFSQSILNHIRKTCIK